MLTVPEIVRKDWVDGARGVRAAGRAALCVMGLVLFAGWPASVYGQAGASGQRSESGTYAQAIERAHGSGAWHERDAVHATITVNFGGNTVFDQATMRFTTDTARARLDLSDDASVVFDGSKAWVAPASAKVPRPRFHVRTWTYFLAAPFKLDDPGTHLELLGTLKLQDNSYEAARLTFDPGVGDSPDDWYVTYREPANDRLRALAYIVTYDKGQSEAEREPHAVVYEQFEEVSGVTLPMRWRFYHWSKDRGVYGDPIGEVTLSDVSFFEPAADTFAKPEGAREAPLPQ